MLFQVYGDGALWQFCGWLMVFVGLVLANEIARRSKAGGGFSSSWCCQPFFRFILLRFMFVPARGKVGLCTTKPMCI